MVLNFQIRILRISTVRWETDRQIQQLIKYRQKMHNTQEGIHMENRSTGRSRKRTEREKRLRAGGDRGILAPSPQRLAVG